LFEFLGECFGKEIFFIMLLSEALKLMDDDFCDSLWEEGGNLCRGCIENEVFEFLFF
jgi:hypothetical protein